MNPGFVWTGRGCQRTVPATTVLVAEAKLIPINTVGEVSYDRIVFLTSSDVVRFWSHVVKGPHDSSCWIWIGAIAPDGYGRFWTGHEGQQRVLRPSRVALALAEGTSVDAHPVVEHLVCDNPLCVRASGTSLDHLLGSTQSANLARMVARGRHLPHRRGLRSGGREDMYRRSRALRAAVRSGWDDELISQALAAYDNGQPTLF